ncbi:Fic family protein [Hujiaoplasma nucleasis]|uniref:Fic family protein n=1 Tax=Hujiaoplasma nucleasis TaxID=2725268 RepID=A0A7L6N6F2_9MOLU|nr:Fic/DOC family N-terminal domain-containing protein [Hujiaoplasma nucleasis]QLY40149.1 Fic family protein [Hujiaoplasma nucleasis]
MNKLPFSINLNKVEILKQLNAANHHIGELKGILKLLPNPAVVLSLINLSESKDSSAIENIITTYDEIFKEIVTKTPLGGKPKEVINYKKAIEYGLELIKQKGFISTNILVDIQNIIELNKGGIRKLPGTVIMNDKNNEIVHTPSKEEAEIRDLMQNLEIFINENEDYDPLIQLALIHFQFESIHPFYDGNGRTGRILNILYLVLKEKIHQPILYLSKYIIEYKDKYYELLRKCNENLIYIEDFVMYILKGISETSQHTVDLILRINQSIELTKSEMRKRLPDIYRYEIVEHLFSHMYTKNEFFRDDIGISRATATKYLKLLEKEGFITSEQVGKEVIYKNIQLLNLVKD